MKNYSKRCLWLVGGILLSSILCLVVSAVNVNIDISNAVQHINAVRLISNSENNEVIISKIGSNLVNVETNSNIIFGNENVIEESNENSTILGGSNNNVGKGKFSTIIAGLENNISGEGEGNTILGGYENNIKGQNSVIAGGKGNYIEGNASSIVGGENNNIMGNHSVTVGKNNSVTGNLSVAMGINSYVSGNNSFLWSDSSRSDVLEADNVFAIVSQNGMVINSDTSNPNAKLTLGGSLVVASNDKDQDIVCEGGIGAGIVKAVFTGDQYCLCSCDGQGRNSMFGGGICKSICNGDTQPVCGTGVSLIHSGSSYMFEGSCEQGNVVEGTGAYLLDKDNVLHWTCQLGNGESVSCSSSDITPVYRNCELPWGGTIQHGQSVLAYESSNPEGGCVSQLRECNDGNLTGENYQYENCAPGCKKPWSDEYIPSGESLEAFKYNVVGFRDGYLCNLSQNRLCTDGVLDGEDDYKYNECKVEEPAKCFYNDRYYAHLAKLITYNKSEGKCPNEGCDRDMLESICYDEEWKKGGPEFWEEEGEIRMKVPLNDIPEGNPYQYAECKNTSDNDDYTLDRCPSMGSCDCKGVSIANNERPIPACESARKCKLISCGAGYYKDGNSCTQCPTGYTSNVGATAQNQCFISCNDRYHIVTPQASSCTGCANGTYKSGHNVNYGSVSSCVYCTNGPANSNYTTNGINDDCDWQCNAGYYKDGESCMKCPTGYTSNTGADLLSDCYPLPVCGSANGQTYTTQNNIPTSDRCTVGDYGSFSISSTGYASWTCSIGSNSVNCGATTWLSCGGTQPSGQGVEKGSITHPYGSSPSSWQYVMWQNGSLGSCQWRCQNGYNKSGNGCIPIPQCGSLNGSGINNMGSTVNASNFIAGSLCSMGNPSNVSSANDCTGYTWTCTTGGSSVTCNAKRIYHATITGDNASMNSFDYGLVKVGDFCIMDRNLGANQVWDGTTTYSSYIGDVLGYFYNYGNNYGFSNSLTGGSSNLCYVNTDNHTWVLSLEDTRAACNCYNETGTFCYSNICETDQVFCVDSPWWYNDYETDLLYKLNTQQYFLWQKVNGLGLGLGAIYGDDQGFGVRGPCPEGYHIPTIYDRYQLSDYQNSQGEGFIPSLISLPVPGQFSPIGFNQNKYITYQPSYDTYWVSGHTDYCAMFSNVGGWNRTCAPVVDIGEMRSSRNGNITTSKGIGLSNYLPIRCFKD